MAVSNNLDLNKKKKTCMKCLKHEKVLNKQHRRAFTNNIRQKHPIEKQKIGRHFLVKYGF